MNKNFLLDQFSHSKSNNAYALEQYCLQNDVPDFFLLKIEFEAMQKYLWEHLRDQSEPGATFTPDEIAEITEEYCTSKFNWIEPKGIHALNRWLIYKAHENGVLHD